VVTVVSLDWHEQQQLQAFTVVVAAAMDVAANAIVSSLNMGGSFLLIVFAILKRN